MSKVERIKWLVRELNKHRDAYYNDSRPTISDAEYDKMFDELQSLEKDTGIIMSNSPTQTVGYEVKSELQKVKHSHPMLSLDKTKSEDDLIKFAGDKDCILSLKMDGLTVSLTYVEGKLIKAETRGNGEIGEDITHNARVFENIPMTIDCKGRFEIEGEAIITYNDFEKINNTLPEDKKYKNPRNLVSGSVRQLDSGIAAKRHIKFIAWKVPLMEENNLSNSFLYRLNYARCLGFEVVPFLTYTNNDKETLSLIIESLKNGANVNSYPIDGLVLALNDIQYGESLGMTGHHPKHSIAFKFYDEEVETTLLNIEWSMGKSGNLTPVAIFEPVDIDGTTIERASLHNITIMNNLSGGFERIGDTLTIFKANQIIPQIRTWIHTGEYSKERHLDIPLHCPICNSPTKIKQDNDAKVLVCTNPSCRRFNQGVVTINLVDIALSSGGDVNTFWTIFDERTELCHKALRLRHKRLEGTVSDVAPILYQDGAFARLKKGEKIDDLLHNGYSTISLGYAGLYECVKYMTGKSHTDNDKGTAFGLEVMQKLNDKCTEWKIAENIDYSLYGSPIESTTYKFAKCLKKRFGIIDEITDRDYITNSYHVPVFEKIDPFTKLDLESQFQKLSPGGAISYVECADLTKNTKVVLEVVKFIYDHIMYAELNTKSDYCQQCGYDGEIKIIDENGELIWECPNCGNRNKDTMNVTRRTCGYIGTNFWNQGRTEEIKERYVHVDDHESEV